MGLIATSKRGDCDRCPAKNTACRKRKKEMLCLNCCNTEDNLKQLGKQKAVNNLRRNISPENIEQGSMQSLINDLDAVFSKYIRIRYANEKGIVTCFICDRPFHISGLDNGHYVSRSCNELRHSEDNCYPSCRKCNIEHETNIIPFKEAIERHRKGLTEYLEQQSRQVFKQTIDELKMKLFEYREKLKFVESKLIK